MNEEVFAIPKCIEAYFSLNLNLSLCAKVTSQNTQQCQRAPGHQSEQRIHQFSPP